MQMRKVMRENMRKIMSRMLIIIISECLIATINVGLLWSVIRIGIGYEWRLSEASRVQAKCIFTKLGML